jgi:hypothetical protein
MDGEGGRCWRCRSSGLSALGLPFFFPVQGREGLDLLVGHAGQLGEDVFEGRVCGKGRTSMTGAMDVLIDGIGGAGQAAWLWRA